MTLSEKAKPELKVLKAARRASARALRDAIPPDFRRAASEKISLKLLQTASFCQCEIILCYYPVASEPDILPVAAEALRHGKTVGFPICDYQTGDMEFYAVDTLFDMIPRGKMNIPEPKLDEARKILPSDRTMALFPGLLFDRAGRRIGYGRGMYDKYVRRFPALLHSGNLCGVCYAALLSDTPLPSEKTDVDMTFIITEEEEWVSVCKKSASARANAAHLRPDARICGRKDAAEAGINEPGMVRVKDAIK